MKQIIQTQRNAEHYACAKKLSSLCKYKQMKHIMHLRTDDHTMLLQTNEAHLAKTIK